VSATTTVDVRPLGGRFGVEVVGLDPVDDLDRRELEHLRDLLLRHKVLGLRGQHLDAAAQGRFVARFGAPPASRRPGGAALPPLGHDLTHVPSPSRWVTPRSYLHAPPAVVTLRAATPDVVDECSRFADAGGAYRDLPDPLRALADRSWAVHARFPDHDAPSAELVAHPVTRLHTETGERGLLLGGHARQILGLTVAESRTILQLLQSYLVQPHNVVRWDWQAGDLLLVDTRAVQWHARPGAGPGPATVATAEILGDTPLGIDGQHSRAVPGARRSA